MIVMLNKVPGGGKVLAQSLTSQSSFLSASDPRLHFGLGAASKASVEVRWPAGTTETFADLPVNHPRGSGNRQESAVPLSPFRAIISASPPAQLPPPAVYTQGEPCAL